MKRISIAAAFVLSAVLVYNLAMQEEAAGALKAGGRAPALILPDVDGNRVSLADLAGKVVLVDFWATWCPPCQKEIPDLVKMDLDLDPKGFTILGVAMDDEGAPALRAFTARQTIPYPVVLSGPAGAPAGWPVPGLPTAYLIGRDGKILERWIGGKDPDELRTAIEAALAAPVANSEIAGMKIKK